MKKTIIMLVMIFVFSVLISAQAGQPDMEKRKAMKAFMGVEWQTDVYELLSEFDGKSQVTQVGADGGGLLSEFRSKTNLSKTLYMKIEDQRLSERLVLRNFNFGYRTYHNMEMDARKFNYGKYRLEKLEFNVSSDRFKELMDVFVAKYGPADHLTGTEAAWHNKELKRSIIATKDGGVKMLPYDPSLEKDVKADPKAAASKI